MGSLIKSTAASYLFYGFIVAFCLIGIALDLSIIDPYNIAWLTSWDHSFHYLGWKAFKSSAWSWPIGFMDNILYPFGTVIQNTDSIPLLALFFKLFKSILPADFQYFGIWLLVCWALQFYVGAKIASLYSSRKSFILVAGVFFTTLPLLIYRVIHPALCAHWLILLPIYFYLYEARTGKKVNPICFILLTAIAALVHPYLLLMSMILNASAIINSTNKVLIKIFLIIVISLTAFIFNYICSGNWFSQVSSVSGFGAFKADLSAFINCYNTSFWSLLLNASPQTYEGYAFIGFGTLIFSPLIISLILKPGRHMLKYLILFLTVSLMGIYSLSTPVEFLGEPLIDIKFYKKVADYTQVIRSSGRFIWPMYYCLVILILKSCLCLRYATLLLLAITTLNFIDSSLYFEQPFDPRRKYFEHHKPDFYAREINAEEQMKWQDIAAKGYTLLVPNISQEKCTYPRWTSSELNRILYIAAHYGITTNIAQLARYPSEAINKFQSDIQGKIYSDSLSLEFVFLLKEEVRRCLKLQNCQNLGEYSICQSGQSL